MANAIDGASPHRRAHRSLKSSYIHRRATQIVSPVIALGISRSHPWRSTIPRTWGSIFVTLLLVGGMAFASPAAAAPDIRGQQWYLDALRVPEALQLSTGKGVTVAVIDEAGVDASHPDLAGQVLPGIGFASAGANGHSDSSEAWHATMTAGVIAAKGGGPGHAQGIAPNAKILPVALPPKSNVKQLAHAIRWAADHGADVINISMGNDNAIKKTESDAVDYAINKKDAVVVAAVGNTVDQLRSILVPAKIRGVVAVSGASERSDFWSGSMHGSETVLAAPATNIEATFSRGYGDHSGYGKADGTSFATPIVSATAALVRAKYPHLNAASVINRLVKTAKDQGKPGRDQYFGYGTVRPVDALTADVPEVSADPLGKPTYAVDDTVVIHGAAKLGGLTVRAWVTMGIVLVLIVVLVLVLVRIANSRRTRRRLRQLPQQYHHQQQPPTYPRY